MRLQERILIMIAALGVAAFAVGGEPAGQTEKETIEPWRQPAVKTEQPSSLNCKKPPVRVNAGVPDEFFALWKNLPPGTSLWDKDKDESKIIFLGTDPAEK